jgi:hypothetical protein
MTPLVGKDGEPEQRERIPRVREVRPDFIRVPKLCPRYAFLPVLTRLPHRKISNLHAISMASKYKSPSGHHKINNIRQIKG